MFELTMFTESANHKRYRVSLRSSSKQVPSNPSPSRVRFLLESAVASRKPNGLRVCGDPEGRSPPSPPRS